MRASLLLLCWLLGFSAVAQKDLDPGFQRNIDSLRGALVGANDSTRALAWFKMAFEYKNFNGDSTLKYASLSANLIEEKELNMKLYLGRIYGLMGMQYKNKGEYEKSLAHHLRALEASEKYGKPYDLATHHNDLGVLLKQMKRFEEALTHYRLSNIICDTLDMAGGYVITLSNIGTIHDELGNLDSALYYYRLAYDQSVQMGYQNGIVTASSNLGELLCQRGRYMEAMPYLEKTLEIDRATGNRYGQMLSYYNLGNAWVELGSYPKGYGYLHSADTLSASLGARHVRFEVFKGLSRYYELTGDEEKALFYHKRYAELRDSVFHEESDKALAEMRTRFETEKKERENLELTAEIRVQKEQLHKEQLRIMLLSGLTLLILLISALLVRNYRLRQRAEFARQAQVQQQMRFNAVIEAEEKERMRIAKELHDGLGQLLSTAKLNVASLEGDVQEEDEVLVKNSMDLIDQSIREVRNISHNLMPSALIELGLVPALNDLFKKINDSKLLRVDFVLRNFDERLNGSTEIALYRIIQEVINNMIRHSKADTIQVNLEKVNGKVKLSMEDNGVGFDKNRINESGGLGWKNIISRVSMINGMIDVDSSPGRGTVINIDLSL